MPSANLEQWPYNLYAICGARGFVKEMMDESNMQVLVKICSSREELE